MRPTIAVFRREFAGYFCSPVGYVFLIAFQVVSVSLAFSRFAFGGFFQAGSASLETCFYFYPWLFLFLVPAVGMRLWAEERRSGTLELLLTFPLTRGQAVLGKFLAGWAFLGLAIAMGFPMAVTIGYLGRPDWGVVASGYVGSVLMAGGYLGVCSLASALTRSQVVSFVLGLGGCAALLFLGLSAFTATLTGILPVAVADAVANFSFGPHFDDFQKGVVDAKDVAFFLSLPSVALALTVLALESPPARLRGRLRQAATVGLLLAALLLVNDFATCLPGRIDATADRIYTLSPGTRAILAKMEEPVTLDFYWSASATSPEVAYKDFAARVGELLRQYVRAANGHLVLNVIDPRPDTDDEERAMAAGISPQVWPDTNEKFYFGLVASQADQRKSISAFSPNREPFLEYDLSALITSVQQFDKKRLGLLTTLPLQGSKQNQQIIQVSPDPQLVVGEWERSLTVVPIDSTATTLPDDLDMLAVIQPESPKPELQFAIDQFLLSGRPVLLALDPSSNFFRQSEGQVYGRNMPDLASDLPRLLRAYGIAYDATRVVADPEHSAKTRVSSGAVVRYPAWLALDRDNFNPKAMPTAQLDSMLLIEPGSFAVQSDPARSVTPLIESGPQAGEVPVADLASVPPDELAREIRPAGRKMLAALITGTFPTAFPGGDPRSRAARANRAPGAPASAALAKSKSRSTLLLIADTDWLFDHFSVRSVDLPGQAGTQLLNDNLIFGANAMDYLAGSEALVSIRSKGGLPRPFLVVRRMEAEAQKKYQAELNDLQERLNAVKRRLEVLRAAPGGSQSLLATPEVEKSIANFEGQEAAMQHERRRISLVLREGIDALENHLLALNLLATPALLCVFGCWFHRRRRRRTDGASP